MLPLGINLRPMVIVVAVFIALLKLDGIADRIQDTSTTRFVGVFPANMDELVALVGRTKNRLVIAGDYCAYGHFSQPEKYQAYRQALLSLPTRNPSVHIEMYLYNPAVATAVASDQFREWDSIRNSATFKHYFEYYKNDHTRPTPTSRDEFITLMQKEQDRCVEELQKTDFNNIHIQRSVAHPLPIFVWLRDDQEAMFSLNNPGPSVSREVSLLTNDSNLVYTLREIAFRVRSGELAELESSVPEGIRWSKVVKNRVTN